MNGGADVGIEAALLFKTIGGDRTQPCGKNLFTGDQQSGSKLEAETGKTGDFSTPVNSLLEVSYQYSSWLAEGSLRLSSVVVSFAEVSELLPVSEPVVSLCSYTDNSNASEIEALFLSVILIRLRDFLLLASFSLTFIFSLNRLDFLLVDSRKFFFIEFQ